MPAITLGILSHSEYYTLSNFWLGYTVIHVVFPFLSFFFLLRKFCSKKNKTENENEKKPFKIPNSNPNPIPNPKTDLSYLCVPYYIPTYVYHIITLSMYTIFQLISLPILSQFPFPFIFHFLLNLSVSVYPNTSHTWNIICFNSVPFYFFQIFLCWIFIGPLSLFSIQSHSEDYFPFPFTLCGFWLG